MKPHYLPSKEIKIFLRFVEEQFGQTPPELKTGALLQNKEKIYLITRDIDNFNLDSLQINNMGLYIAEVKNGQLRLSIEGSQIIGPYATKNVCDITQEQAKLWLTGQDITITGNYAGFVILKCGNDYLGSGKYSEGTITNYFPKARRVLDIHSIKEQNSK